MPRYPALTAVKSWDLPPACLAEWLIESQSALAGAKPHLRQAPFGLASILLSRLQNCMRVSVRQL
jgi:hypothetical protein